MAHNQIARHKEPKNFESLTCLRKVVSHKINSNTVTLEDVITTLNKAQIRIVPRLDAPTNIRLPRFLNEARFKPRRNPRIQVFSIYQVFGVAELLEKILVELPAATILSCRAVNTFFKATIDGTRSLQQALFRMPLPAIPLSERPQLNSFFESLNSYRGAGGWFYVGLQLATPKCTFKFDHIEFQHPGVEEGEELSNPTENTYRVHLWLSELNQNFCSRKHNKEWCAMLLCQPPRAVVVHYQNEEHFFAGSTLDEVVDELWAKIRRGYQSIIFRP